MIAYHVIASDFSAAKELAASLFHQGFKPEPFELEALPRLAERHRHQPSFMASRTSPFICYVFCGSEGVSVLPFKLTLGEKS